MPAANVAGRAAGDVRRSAGFTLVELVTVIAIVAIISGVAVAGRFADRAPFEARGFASQFAQFVSAGQRLAVAQRRDIYVTVDTATGRISLCLVAPSPCTQPISAAPRLSASDADWLQAPPGVRIAGSSTVFSFSSNGTPSFASSATFRLTDVSGNDLNAGITLEGGSGHARTF